MKTSFSLVPGGAMNANKSEAVAVIPDGRVRERAEGVHSHLPTSTPFGSVNFSYFRFFISAVHFS